ncbi:MAG TPA: hypothetical protein VJ894_04230, partial [Cryomorphaceae bacterium]|nr:hypothetical protein [Cryomorphaceae bacterium]
VKPIPFGFSRFKQINKNILPNGTVAFSLDKLPLEYLNTECLGSLSFVKSGFKTNVNKREG